MTVTKEPTVLVSIVIINYNTFQLTCECIQSIRETTHVPYEVILVDNNSKERNPSNFLSVFPDLKLIALKENVGFGRANNRGVEEANGKYILLLNSDTLVREQTIDETVGYLESHPDLDILGCKVMTNGGHIQRTVYEYKGELSFFRSVVFFIKRNTVMKELIRAGVELAQKRRQEESGTGTVVSVQNGGEPSVDSLVPNFHKGKRIGALVGVFLLLKKSVYLESKGFDPDFFMYDEETNWFLKRLRNYKIVFYPAVEIFHYYGASNVYKKMNLQHHVSQYLFWYKISVAHYLLFFFYNLLEVPSKAIIGLVKWDRQYFNEIPVLFKALPYALFDIPRYSNKYGSRKEMLKLRSLRRKGL